MIFLPVGTWRTGYDRLLQAIDDLVKRNIIQDQVIAQVGYSAYKPRLLTCVDFCSPDTFAAYIDQASIIVSHAGVGTMSEAIKRRKPVVVLPRKASLGEVDNDHQFVTARELENEGKILVAYETDQLKDKIKQAATFQPAPGAGADQLLKEVQTFIETAACEKVKRRSG